MSFDQQSPSSAFTGDSTAFPTKSDCRACIDIRQWAKNAMKSAFSSKQSAKPALECPPDSQELGRATWTFLHTMSAYYPEKPNEQQQSSMRSFIKALSNFYPCGYCAEHLREHLKENEPQVSTRQALSKWFCDLHNEVNERLGKPYFDCTLVMKRWKDGCQDEQEKH
jgi:FAD-linked sulfhydryl oxidase